MRLTSLIILFFIIQGTLSAADLFGNDSVQVAEGEMPYNEQKALYNEFFGEKDSAASNSSKRLKLAKELFTQLDSEDYTVMRRYILHRIEALTADSKKADAIELQVFVCKTFYKDKEPNREDNNKLITLLEKQYAKSKDEKKLAALEELLVLHQENAGFALTAKDFAQAESDYKALAALFTKAKDKEGAAQIKNILKHISAHVKEKKKMLALQEKADADASDHKSNASVGRYFAKNNDWKTAQQYLINGQEQQLADISKLVTQEEPKAQDKASCILQIANALTDRDTKKNIALQRSLLELGLALKSELQTDDSGVDAATKIKYKKASKDFSDLYGALPIDPLANTDVVGSSFLANEDRLLKMGWKQIFDHENKFVKDPPHGKAKSVVKNGIEIINMKPGGYLYLMVKTAGIKGIKLRIKNVSKAGYNLATMNGGKEFPLLNIKRGNITWSQQGKDILETREFPEGEFHDITFLWDDKEATASLNGEEFKDAIPFNGNDITFVRFNFDTTQKDEEVHIQSLLGLEQ